MWLARVKKLSLTLIPLLVIVTFLGIPILPVMAVENDWTIDGDKVYINDDNVYLSASPHTLRGSGWVEFELESKNYEGEIDVVWGFVKSAGITPKTPQIWANNVPHEMERWIDVPRAGSIRINNIVSFEVLTVGSVEPDIGNANNTKLVRLMVEPDRPDNLDPIITYVIAFNSHIEHNETSATFCYNYTSHEKEYYIEYYPDYKPLNISNFTRVNYDYMGVDDWSFVKFDASIQKNTRYKVRIWVNVPFIGLDGNISKYVWGVKPSNKTIQEAKEQDCLYLLDPWLDASWGQRVKLTIDSGDIGANLTDFPFMAYISASSGINSEDISFVFDELQNDANRKKIAVTTSDGETQCYVEIEQWDDANEKAWLWIEAPAVASGTNTDFYLYYDRTHADNDAYVGDPNDAVSENVWDANHVAVTHMRDDPDNAHVRDSTSYDNDGTKKAANQPILTASGQIGEAQDFDGADDFFTLPKGVTIDDLTNFTYEAWVRFDAGFGGANPMFLNKDGKTQIFGDAGVSSDWQAWRDYDGAANAYSQIQNALAATTWYYLVASLSSADDKIRLYIDGTEVVYGTQTAGIGNLVSDAGDDAYIGDSAGGGLEIDGILDEIRLSDSLRDAHWIKASYESGLDDLLDWGTEEAATLPTVTTQAATNIEATTATGNGNITAIGSDNSDIRGIVWDLASQGAPGNVAPAVSGYANDVDELGDFGTGAFTINLVGLPTGRIIYARAYSHNTIGYAYGAEINFLTKPAAPTNVAATDGAHPDKVVITWTKSTGATDYHVWRDAVDLGAAGDVATFDDAGADAGTITDAGTATASDGMNTLTLSLAGESTSDGAAHTYKVVASNATGDSADSLTDTGYRGNGVITYQWQRSSADADADYSNLAGATTDPYDDGTMPDFPTRRYFQCVVSSVDASNSPQTSTSDRGYKSPSTGVGITHQAAIILGNFATGIGQLLIIILCLVIAIASFKSGSTQGVVIGLVCIVIGIYFLYNAGWMSSAPPLE